MDQAQSDQSPIPVSHPVKKRTRSNVTQACMNCRRRKAKCDGVQPVCSKCFAYKDECTWSVDEDGRKPASRQYVVALESRVKALEARLSALHQVDDQSPVEAFEQDDAENVDEGGTSVDQATQSMLHLYMGNAGEEVYFHGPTSAFAHSSTARTAASSADPMLEVSMSAPHDYRRHLPPSVDLTYAQHSLVLDRFFRCYASWGMRATAPLFHADLIRAVTLPPNTPPVRFTYYSPALHNLILAVALRFSEEAHLRTFETRSVFAAEADKYMKVEMSRPTLATVHALALKSSWHSLSGQHSAGWVYFGLAERLTQSMGLHLDCAHLVEKGRMFETEMLLRRDTFWNMFCQEQCWSVYIGRCHSVQEYSTPLPVVDPKLDEIPWTWDNFGARESLTAQPSMYSTTFVETAKLARIQQKVMATLYSLSADMKKIHNHNVISKIGLSIDAWTEQLPPSLVITSHSDKNALPHIIMLQLAKEWTLILTYRPHYRPIIGLSLDRSAQDKVSMHTLAVQRCDRSAARINSLLRLYEQRVGVRFSPPTLTHITFTAGTTHLLAAVHHRSVKGRAEALASAEECTQILRLIAVSWSSADSKADILDSLIKDYVPPSRPSADSPQSEELSRAGSSHEMSTLRATGRPSPDHRQDHAQQRALPIPFTATEPLYPSTSPLQAVSGIQRGRGSSMTSEDLGINPFNTHASFSPSDFFNGTSSGLTVDDPNYFIAPAVSSQTFAGLGTTQSNQPLDPFLQSLFSHITFPPVQSTGGAQPIAINGQQAQYTNPGFGQSPNWDPSFMNTLFGGLPLGPDQQNQQAGDASSSHTNWESVLR